ncbi:hypothetical protein [Chitinimonas lacunae]|uniref:Uncharacterized protein n=1 Tax=Chitinimonas lacunae TaxID=1963018 RepID=A0ABV8MP52_9NEIS
MVGISINWEGDELMWNLSVYFFCCLGNLFLLVILFGLIGFLAAFGERRNGRVQDKCAASISCRKVNIMSYGLLCPSVWETGIKK